MKKRNLNPEEAKALYVINKEAKRNRDLSRSTRQKLKAYLFEEKDLDLSEEEKEVFGEYGLNPCPYFTVGDLEVHHFKDLRKYNAPLYEQVQETIYYDSSYDTEDRDILSEVTIDETITFEACRKMGLSEDGCEMVMYTINEVIEWNKEYELAKEKYNKYHEYLQDNNLPVRQRQQLLYDLKSCVLSVCGDEPVCYHHIEGDDVNCGAYYIIHGFRIHELVEETEDIALEDGVSISDVSSNNTNAKELSVQEALVILFNYLEVGELQPELFLKGKYGKISEMLGIKIVESCFTPRNRLEDIAEYDNGEDYYANRADVEDEQEY